MTDNEKDEIRKYIEANARDWINSYIIGEFFYYIQDKMDDELSRAMLNHKYNFDFNQTQINSIKEMIQEHAIGVQNVYDQFKKITDTEFLSDFSRMENGVKEKIKSMEKNISIIHKSFQNCYEKMNIISDLFSLKNTSTPLIEDISKIISMLKDQQSGKG